MPLKSHKPHKDADEEVEEKKDLKAEFEKEEEIKEEAEEKKDGPKINFEYDESSEDIDNEKPVKKEETLEELASKYREEPEEEVEVSPEEVEDKSEKSADSEETIPHMRANMPTSGIYSAQDIRRGNGELHQAPYMRSSFSNHNNENYHPNKSSKMHFVILALIGLVVLGSAVYLLKYQFKAVKPSPTATSAPVVQATPSPSPTPTPIDRSKYTVRVLNGTGKSGLAASVAAQLKDLGYKTDKTGNAPSADETTIKAKPGSDDLIKQLILDLSGSFTASSASASLKSSDASDAEVTLGGK